LSNEPVEADEDGIEVPRDPLDVGITVLRIVAGVALLCWMLAFLLTAWSTWEATSEVGSSSTISVSLEGVPRYPEPVGTSTVERLRAAFLTAVRASPEYLVAFVLAFGVAMYLDLRLRSIGIEPAPSIPPSPSMKHTTLDGLDDDDDLEPDGLRTTWRQRIATALEVPSTGARILMWIAVAAFLLWGVHLLHTAWTTWDTLGDYVVEVTQVGAVPPTDESISLLLRLRLTFQVTMITTWSSLLVAVVAYGFALVVGVTARDADEDRDDDENDVAVDS
jgi:hypothetical protein